MTRTATFSLLLMVLGLVPVVGYADSVTTLLAREFSKPAGVACKTGFVSAFPETDVELDRWCKANLGKEEILDQRLLHYAEAGDTLAAQKLLCQLRFDGAYGEEGDDICVHFAMKAPCEFVRAYVAFGQRRKLGNLFETADWDDMAKAISAVEKGTCRGVSTNIRIELLEKMKDGLTESKRVVPR